MRTLSKERPSGDPTKYDEMKQAMKELMHAHRFFSHLHQLGRAAGLDSTKVKHHVEFVAQTHDNSLVGGLGRANLAMCANRSAIAWIV